MAAVWTMDKITELIDLYEDYPCLYNTKDKNYHDRDCRNKAVAEIAAKLEITGMFSAITSYYCRFTAWFMYLWERLLNVYIIICFTTCS